MEEPFITPSLRILCVKLINNPNDVKSEKSVVDTKTPLGKDIFARKNPTYGVSLVVA